MSRIAPYLNTLEPGTSDSCHCGKSAKIPFCDRSHTAGMTVQGGVALPIGFRWLSAALLSAVLAFSASPAMAEGRYRLVRMGDLSGTLRSSWAVGINNSGIAVGYAQSVFSDTYRALRWDTATGEVTFIDDWLSVPRNSAAKAVSDLGQVVGHVNVAAPGGGGAFFWEGAGAAVPLGALPPGTSGSGATDLNESGTVVGTSGYSAPGVGGICGFRWDAGEGLRPIGFLPGDDHSAALAVNEPGQIVGYSARTGTKPRAFLWDPAAGFTVLAPDALASWAYDVNDAGQVVGTMQRDTDGDGVRDTWEAYLWSAARGATAFVASGDGRAPVWAQAFAVNNRGVAVGNANWLDVATTQEPFVWRAATGMVQLGTLVDESAAGWRLFSAEDVNEPGTIAGFGMNPQGAYEAFVLVDTQEAAPGDLLRDGSFEGGGVLPDEWTASGLGRDDRRVCRNAYDGSCLLRLTGAAGRKILQQTIETPPWPATYDLGGWGAASRLTKGGGFHGLRAAVHYADGVVETHAVPFPRRTHGWQRRSTTFAVSRPATKIVVSLVLARQSGSAHFDDVNLTPLP